jgi:hypothetical protein
VTVVSTSGIRAYAGRAKVPYAEAVLYLVIGSLLNDLNPKLHYHNDTRRCPLDFCDNRDDLVKGLKHMRFGDAKRRNKVRDKSQLSAVDALMAVDVPSGSTGREGGTSATDQPPRLGVALVYNRRCRW